MSQTYCGVGARKTPMSIMDTMSAIAWSMSQSGIVLRSGGAVGADSAFEKGAGTLKEIFVPHLGFNYRPIINDIVPEITPQSRSMTEKFHPAPNRLSAKSFKLMHRNSFQVLGEHLDDPVSCVIAWTPDGGFSGGTGQALRIADAYGIPIFNLYWAHKRNEIMNILEIHND